MSEGAPVTKPILIVEDELFIGLDVAEELEARGYSVYGPISNVNSATQVIEMYSLAAAILDYRLQDGTSAKLAERLIEKGVPVIFYTGNADQLASTNMAGKATILSKPASTEEIASALDRVTAKT